MDKKTKRCYDHMFKYINENIFELQPKSFMTDFECALQNSLKTVFPNAKCHGCWFHYCQSLRRNIAMKHKDLAVFIRASKSASLAYHKLLALPLLPAKSIQLVYYTIKEEILVFDTNNKFSTFTNYFEKQWIKKVTIEHIYYDFTS